MQRSEWSVVLLCLSAVALTAQTKTDTVVRNATSPVHSGIGTLTRDLSIGVTDGAEHYVIGGIGDIAVAQNGTIYLFDRMVPAIRMYDARGTYVKSIGRRGSGPGEYQSGAAIAIAKNGNLLMFDPGNARINVYTPNGDVVTHWPTGARGTGTAAGKGLLKVDATGDIYIFLFYAARSPSGTLDAKSAWLRFGADGAFRDTVHPPAFPKEDLLTFSNGRQMMNRVVPFAPMNLTQLSPAGYLVTGRTDRIALDLHMTPGQVVSIRRQIPRKPVSNRERDSARTELTGEFRKMSAQWSWNGPDIPPAKPAYTGFNVAADGRIWVELEEGPHKASSDGDDVVITSSRRGGRGRANAPGGFGSACPEAGSKLYDVYEPSGRYLGQVRTPERIEMVMMRGDFVWASACNEDDAPVMVRYKISWR